MFAIVFTTRYLDLFTNFISLYNTCMKVFFIGSSFFTVFLMYHKFRATYDSNHDTFRMEFLIVPVGGLAFLVNHDFSPLEVSRCSSIKPNQRCLSSVGFTKIYANLYTMNMYWNTFLAAPSKSEAACYSRWSGILLFHASVICCVCMLSIRLLLINEWDLLGSLSVEVCMNNICSVLFRFCGPSQYTLKL